MHRLRTSLILGEALICRVSLPTRLILLCFLFAIFGLTLLADCQPGCSPRIFPGCGVPANLATRVQHLELTKNRSSKIKRADPKGPPPAFEPTSAYFCSGVTTCAFSVFESAAGVETVEVLSAFASSFTSAAFDSLTLVSADIASLALVSVGFESAFGA